MNVLSVYRRLLYTNIYRRTGSGGAIRDNRANSISVLFPIFHSDKPSDRKNRESNNRVGHSGIGGGTGEKNTGRRHEK